MLHRIKASYTSPPPCCSHRGLQSVSQAQIIKMKYALGILGFIGLSNAVAVAEPQPIADSADDGYELVNGYTSVDAQSSHSASHNQYNTGYTSIEFLHSQYSSHYAFTTGYTSIDRSSPGSTGVTQNSPAQTGGSTNGGSNGGSTGGSNGELDDGSDDGLNTLPTASSGSPPPSLSTQIALQIRSRRGTRRRQASKPNLLTDDSVTSRDCNVATFYVLDTPSRLIDESGKPISASGGPNAQNQMFSSKAIGDVTTGFALRGGVLTWRNPAFINGFAYFCQVPAGQVFAIVRNPAPDGCVNVTLASLAGKLIPNRTKHAPY